jgi:hypothetical protein
MPPDGASGKGDDVANFRLIFCETVYTQTMTRDDRPTTTVTVQNSRRETTEVRRRQNSDQVPEISFVSDEEFERVHATVMDDYADVFAALADA